MIIFNNSPLKYNTFYLYGITQFELATFKVTESHAANDCFTRLPNDLLLTKNTAHFVFFFENWPLGGAGAHSEQHEKNPRWDGKVKSKVIY